MITNASYGTLYPTLHKLLAETAVHRQEMAQTGRPSKKVYQITHREQHELLDWLKRPAAADQGQREFLLKLYLARHLAAEDLRSLVGARLYEFDRLEKALQADKDQAASPQAVWVMDDALAMCASMYNG